MDAERFNKVYLNLPEAERKTTIVIINGSNITWEKAFNEIRKKTSLGKTIYGKLLELGAI
ncbi:MAG: hypothetical protein HY832_02290 [Candidatus Aenigmarchaeota archaeon]|nr:hypothetical protein [Candidatus Aenigmarchaeota archaeon]